MGALLWLLIPLLVGLAASVWAWGTGHRHPGLPGHDTWEDLDRYQRLRSALSTDEHATTA
ncbi:hypothetical protein ACWDBW_31680 [Streptomyces sp. NPDC001107]